MEFKEKLKKLRTEKGLSQQALADAIYVSRSAVAKWENGLGWPSADSLEALTAFFGVEDTWFRTEEPDTVIVGKNRRIRLLQLALAALAALVLSAVLVLVAGWFRSVSASDREGLARQAADYLKRGPLELVLTEKRGDFLAALFKTGEGDWCMCVFDRSPVFQNRWVAGGGKPSFDAGTLTSWNYGSPREGAVLVFCGGGLSPDIAWYTFVNSGIHYTCPVTDRQVLDVFVIPDHRNINGSPVPLNEDQVPIS